MNDSLLARFQSLTRQERRVLWLSWWLLPGVTRRVRKKGMSLTREWLADRDFGDLSGLLETEGQLEIHHAQAMARLVNIAARRHFFRVHCLDKSLLLEALLNASGIQNVLRFGVQEDADSFQGHAWVEVEGQPVGDPGMRYPGRRALV